MTSSTYGTAELQGDASPASPKSYRLSKNLKAAKIALGSAAPVASTPLKGQVQDLQARVGAIEKYLQAAGGGGSGNSRQQIHRLKQFLADADGGGR